MTSNKDLKECVLCGRRGVQGFDAADARSWRCSNRQACQHRVDDAERERLAARGGGPAVAGVSREAALAGLAREVEALRMAMEAVSPLPEQVRALHGQVAPLPAQVTKLARVVKTLVEQAGLEEGGARLVRCRGWIWLTARGTRVSRPRRRC